MYGEEYSLDTNRFIVGSWASLSAQALQELSDGNGVSHMVLLWTTSHQNLCWREGVKKKELKKKVFQKVFLSLELIGPTLWCQDYLVFRAETMIPMANHAFNSNSDWQHVSTQRLLPCMMHMELGLGTALQIVENDEDNEEYGLLKSALRAHVFILAENLKSITAKVGAKVPTFPNGSGARGSVVKADHARALIDLLFGDGETQKAKEDMINALAPPVKPKKKVAETLSQDDEIMAMIAQLDPENAAAFHRMADLANAKLSEVYKHEGAEEVKKRVREALEAEGMEVDFQKTGSVKITKKKALRQTLGDFRNSSNYQGILLLFLHRVVCIIMAEGSKEGNHFR